MQLIDGGGGKLMRKPSTEKFGITFQYITWWCVLGAVLLIAFKCNPFEYFMEASGAAYYQARIAYIRGSPEQRAKIRTAFVDGKINMRVYSNDVFPLFVKVAHDGESLLPTAEGEKTVAQQRYELTQAISSTK